LLGLKFLTPLTNQVIFWMTFKLHLTKVKWLS